MSLYKKEHPEYLRLALDSMINQTVKPDEIVLVEDGPLTDELYEVIDEYKDRLNIVKNEKNMGLGLALNEGLKACRNELVARMDTDDISETRRCEKQLEYFSEYPDTAILGGQIAEFIGSVDNVIGRRIVPETDAELKNYLKVRCPFNHMTVMFKKTEVLKAGNYQDWFWNEDYYLWVRLALQGSVFANLPDTFVYTRVGEDMYKRRGGKKYYISEIKLQRYMLSHKVIGYSTYLMNCGKRLILEILMPASLRGWVYKRFARS